MPARSGRVVLAVLELVFALSVTDAFIVPTSLRLVRGGVRLVWIPESPRCGYDFNNNRAMARRVKLDVIKQQGLQECSAHQRRQIIIKSVQALPITFLLAAPASPKDQTAENG